MKPKYRILPVFLAVLMLVSCRGGRDGGDTSGSAPSPDTVPLTEGQERDTSALTAGETEETADTAGETDTEPGTAETGEPYVSPIDFDYYRQVNPDIYAWIEIPGTVISYPILQHPTDDTYYLRRNVYGQTETEAEDAIVGVIFTEHQYNGKDFTDPVTLIYGHYSRKDRMFGPLQRNFSKKSFFEENREIIIYLPERTIRYKIFAATPFSNSHILANQDMSQLYFFDSFFYKVKNTREIGTVMDKDSFPVFGDRVIILSTCLNGNNTKRYLVMAVEQTEELPGESSAAATASE